MKQAITNVPGTPKTSSPYSSGVLAEGKFLFVSGQGPYDPAQEIFVRESIGEQTRLTLECIQRIVEAAGGKMENIVSCRVFLQQLTEKSFQEMNKAYANFFGENQPTRTTIGCQLLNIDIEIDCVVLMD